MITRVNKDRSIDGNKKELNFGDSKSTFLVFFWPFIPKKIPHVFPKIAIAIGVLTSNRRRRTTLADWTWHQGAIAGCSGRGAIAGWHRGVPL